MNTPSFRRKITHNAWESEEEKSAPKKRVYKFSKTSTFETTIIEKLYIYLDCGHKISARGYGRDLTKLKSMDCFQCYKIWKD